MIYDTLNNLPNYLGLCSSLDSVIEFIMARDINNLPAGRTRIDGDKAVVTVSTVTPQASDKAQMCIRDSPHPAVWPERRYTFRNPSLRSHRARPQWSLLSLIHI